MHTGQVNQACIFNIQKFSIHDGPGIRTAVFLKGCPLRCLWCSNPESQAAGAQPERETPLAGRLYALNEVMDICLADKDFYIESGGGVTLTGGEALMQADFAAELLRSLKAEGIHTALETTGFASTEVFLEVIAYADLLLYDVKHFDSEKHCEGTGAGNEIILKNLREAVKRSMDILIRVPVIPGYNDSLSDARGFAELITSCGLSEAQLLPFHQFGQKKYKTLGIPYALSNQKTLHPEDLREYQLEMEKLGVRCFF